MSEQGIAQGVKQQQQDIAGLRKDIAKTTAEESATEAAAYKGYTSDLKAISEQFEKLKKEGEDVLKSFEAPKPQDPLKSYGASMAGLMGIVSFFTHSSMLPALNAATGAINAAKAGNSEEYDRKFNEWKTNTELATKKLTWENEQLHTILDLAKTHYDAATAHAKTLATITQDKALSATLDAQGIEGVAKLYDARIKGSEELDRHKLFLLEYGQKVQLDKALKQFTRQQRADPSTLPPPNAGRKVDLYSVSGPMGELSGMAGMVTGVTAGKTYGEASRHVASREALEQLREKTLDAFRTSQVGRSLASQMKAVDDITPTFGLVTYPTLRESVKQTRDNLAGLITTLADDAQSAYALGNKGKLTEDISALNKAQSVLRDYDAILADNPDPGVTGVDLNRDQDSTKGRPPLSSFFKR